MDTIKQTNQQLESLLKKGNISREDFRKIDNIIALIGSQIRNNILSKSDVAKINSNFPEDFVKNTVQGHGLSKPFGYAGDYLMIDKIYTYHKSDKPEYAIWDEYLHQQSAPIAVRNRKEYFKNVIEKKMTDYTTLKLLDVASGPARDLYEVYSKLPLNKTIHTTCIEMDENAIFFAKGLNHEFLNSIKFVHKNIFKHRESEKYDLIWSAGLFDYFSDKAFLMVLGKFKEWLKVGGEIIIGNFNEDYNPSRDYMEIFGDWYLNHRTEEQLFKLAIFAGFKGRQIRIGKEPENVNLFLHIRND
ncbi:MAG: class I SAM-dependent methyltransferase [Bacteroidetes bacterium]|nr:class I SAM-dependent methyltransferase [Bacteroidota bacterium]